MSVRTKQTTQQTKRTPVTGSEEMLNFLVRAGVMLACRHIGFQLLKMVFP